jgi:hypothetical protein
MCYICLALRIFGSRFPQPSNCGANSHGRSRGESVGTTCHHLATRLTVPNSSTRTFHRGLSTKGTAIRAVLRDFNLAHQLSECGTVSGSILSRNANLFRALAHNLINEKTIEKKDKNKELE